MSYIDTRELADERDTLRQIATERTLYEDEAQRVVAIDELESKLSWLDFDTGGLLIPEDEFEEYTQSYAENIGAVEDAAHWPATYIDWTRAADELRMDFAEVEFDGTTYLVRA